MAPQPKSGRAAWPTVVSRVARASGSIASEEIIPRYFLDLTNSPSHTDDRGQMFGTLDDARAEAIRYTGELLRNEKETLAEGHDLRVDIADEAGNVLFSVCADAPRAGRADVLRSGEGTHKLRPVRPERVRGSTNS